MEPKKIVVTGGAGFIGSHVVELLAKREHEILVVDNLSSGNRDNLKDVLSSIQFVKADICDKDAHDKILEFQPHVMIHLAAQPSLLESQKDPVFDAKINILGTIQMAMLAKKMQEKLDEWPYRFVFTSTSAVESGWNPYFFNTDCPMPDAPYGISKLAAEHYLQKLGVSAMILRLGNVYGPRQVPLGENQLVPRALDHIYNGADFQINNEGTQTRDFVYVKDVASAIVRASWDRYDTGGTFNVSTGHSHSVLEVLVILRQLTKFKKDWPSKYNNVSERGHVEMPNELFMRTFEHWKPRYSLYEGLAKTVEWHKR